MALLRYRETGEIITETEFRFRNRKRRPYNVPAQGQLTEVFLDSEGVDPIFNGPGDIEELNFALESEVDKVLVEPALNPYSDKTFPVHILLEDGGCIEYEKSSQLLTEDNNNLILQSNIEYEQTNGKWFTSVKNDY